ncbi:MAG: ATP-dependent RecD-like DNA helicase [Oscillospiraceae bacterium]|nr:ATP-dependent RecD-like DNA helicase [Oscillospiraceae bacterium]
MEKLEGQIQSVVYGNEGTGYTVVRLALPDGALVTAVGYIPFAAPGEYLKASGQWIEHPVHGSQFSVQALERSMPESSQAILEYLSSGAVRGIGPSTARLMVEKFGSETLNVMALESERLAQIRGITPKRARAIQQAFSQKNAQRRCMELLAGHGLSPGFALELFKQYGDDAEERLRGDPYILLFEPFRADFIKTDKLAESFGLPDDDPKRCRAGILYELIFNLNEGHSYLPKDKLIPAAGELLNLGEDLISGTLLELCCQGALAEEKNSMIYLPRLYRAEKFVSQFVLQRFNTRFCPTGDIERLVGEIELEAGICYGGCQKEAVLTAAKHSLMILTGGPGTGKTTAVRGMLRLFEHMGLKARLAAPTGRAAKRLAEMTGREAVTIHRLLEFGYDPMDGNMRFMKDEADPLDIDVLVLDECSMVDILLMESLSRALREDTRLILVGDPDQLPAVGPGNVLEDILKSGRAAAVRLTEIFRQAAKSRIVAHAHAVNRGEGVDLGNDREGDFFFLKRSEMHLATETISELCKTRLPEGLGVEPMRIQVLSPTRRGICGTVNLNKILQQALNPPANHKLEKRFGEFAYREGDKVMQIRNNYDIVWRSDDGAQSGQGVFNGEIGIIKHIEESCLTVQFDDRLAEYKLDELGELEPAFAMTIHKAQGSEYDAVVLAVMPGPPPLMTRRVLYTALTRARDWLVLVGREDVVQGMIQNAKRLRRYSGLLGFLRN